MRWLRGTRNKSCATAFKQIFSQGPQGREPGDMRHGTVKNRESATETIYIILTSSNLFFLILLAYFCSCPCAVFSSFLPFFRLLFECSFLFCDLSPLIPTEKNERNERNLKKKKKNKKAKRKKSEVERKEKREKRKEKRENANML
jgi:hypothetical protein